MPDVAYSLGGVRNETQNEADRTRARMEQMMFEREMRDRAEANRRQLTEAGWNRDDARTQQGLTAQERIASTQAEANKDVARMGLEAEDRRFRGLASIEDKKYNIQNAQAKALMLMSPQAQRLRDLADTGDAAAAETLRAMTAAYDTTSSPYAGLAQGGGAYPQQGAPMGGGMPAAPMQSGGVMAQGHPEVWASGDSWGQKGPTKATFRSDGGYTLPSRSPYHAAGLFTGLGPEYKPSGTGNVKAEVLPKAGKGGAAPGVTADDLFAMDLLDKLQGKTSAPAGVGTFAPSATMSAPLAPAPAVAPPAGTPDVAKLVKKLGLVGETGMTPEELATIAKHKRTVQKATQADIYTSDPALAAATESNLRTRLTTLFTGVNSILEKDWGTFDDSTLAEASQKIQDEIAGATADAINAGMPQERVNALVMEMKQRLAGKMRGRMWTGGGRSAVNTAFGLEDPAPAPAPPATPPFTYRFGP